MVLKRAMVVLLSVAWAALIVACGGGNDSGKPPNPAVQPSPQNPDNLGSKPPDNPEPILNPAIVSVMDREHQENQAEKRGQVEAMRNEAKRLRTRNQRRRAEDLEAEADVLEETLFMPIPNIKAPINVGDFGYVEQNLHIVSIVDGSNFLARADFGGDSDFQMLWIEGASTAGHATEMEVRLKSPYRAIGTRDYTTVLGANSRVVVLAPFDPEPYLGKYRTELAAAMKAKEKPQPKELTVEDQEEKRIRTAASKLRLAIQLIERGETNEGKQWLEGIVRDFPDTAAAKEAKAKLDSLK